MSEQIDARVARTHAAVMKAATELLVEGGPEALTVEAVVARSGVAKTTVYRHWESRDALVVAVFQHCAPGFEPPDPDLGFADGLRCIISQVAEALSDENWQRLFPELLLLRAQHPELGELHKKLDSAQTHAFDEIIARGVAEQALPTSVLDDPHATGVLVMGPLALASMIEPSIITPEFVDRTIQQFLDGGAAELERSGRRHGSAGDPS